MQVGSRRMRLVVTGATIAWLICVALVSGGTGMSMRAASTSFSSFDDSSRAGGCHSRAGCGAGRRLRPSGIRSGRSPGGSAGGIANVRRGLQERPGAQRHSCGRIHGRDGALLGRPEHVLPGVSCARLRRRHPPQGDHAQDDSDGEHHQSDELRKPEGRQLLDLPSPDGSSRGHAESRYRVRRADLLGARRSLPAGAGRAQT